MISKPPTPLFGSTETKRGEAIKLEKLFSLHVFVCVLVKGKEMRESKWREN